MDNFSSFDKLNVPIYICDSDWRVVFRNKACKKLTSAPRVNGNISKFFVDKEGTSFPIEGGEGVYTSCLLNNSYKTALCFEYRGYALLMLTKIFEFDLICYDVFCDGMMGFTACAREILDSVLADSFDSEDKYGTLEKIHKCALDTIENYVTLSLFDADKRVLGSFSQIYGFFLKRFVETASKAGYRIETDLSGIALVGSEVYTDTLYYSTVLSAILLFALGISDDKRCIFSSEHIGDFVRNTVSFTCSKSPVLGRRFDGLKGVMDVFPVNYLNVMPYDILCGHLSWRIKCSFTDKELWNGKIVLEIDDNNSSIFRSAGAQSNVTAQEVMEQLLKTLVFFI